MLILYIRNGNFKLKLIDLSDSTAVASGGGTNDQDLTPDAGYIYQIVWMDINIPAPAGATANTHHIRGYVNQTIDSQNIYFIISSNFGDAITCGYAATFTGTQTELPSGDAAQRDLITFGCMWASNNHPLRFRYTNSTDANQTGNRVLKLLVREYQEG